MTDYQKYINALRKCAKEHENDRTLTGHVIVSDLCRDTANLLEVIEQKSILDKIRAEIEERKKNSGGEPNRDIAFNVCLQIIDKYKAESEGKE